MSQYYNQQYTFQEIEDVLKIVKECVSQGRCLVSLNSNRQENIDFIRRYNIRDSIQRDILMRLTANDFCHSLKNIKSGYSNEVLYVFVPTERLIDATGAEVDVDVYIKLNIIDIPSGKRTVVISFHEKNKPVSYLFR